MGNSRGFFVPSARGLGSQMVWYSRELDLVVVSTADIVNDQGDVSQLMDSYVIPSLFTAAPAANESGVVNAASNAAGISPDSFVSIYGTNLAPAPVPWGSVVLDDLTLPTTLGGVSVKAGGRDCWVSYAGPSQVNVLLPPDLPAGPVDIEVTQPGGTAHASAMVTLTAPALFRYSSGDKQYATGVPAANRPGDHIALYATGLGATAPAHPTG